MKEVVENAPSQEEPKEEQPSDEPCKEDQKGNGDKPREVEVKDEVSKDHFSFIGDMIRGNMRDLTLKSPLRELISKTSSKPETKKSIRTSLSHEEPISSITGKQAIKVERSASMKGDTLGRSAKVFSEENDSSSEGHPMDTTLSSSPTF